MKITVSKDLTTLAQLEKVKEDVKEFRGIYRPRDDRMSDAIKEARRWLSSEEASYIYDQQKRIVRHAFRGSPELAFNARAITPACIMHI